MTPTTDSRSPETRLADALLERPTTLELGGRSYPLAPPTLATLILVSEELSQLPPDLLSYDKGEDSPLIVALRTARHAHGLSRALARLILGARPPMSRTERLRQQLHRLAPRLFAAPDALERLALEIEQTTSAHDLALSFVSLTQRLEVQDFFAFTTFLSALRLTQPTREVGSAATALGRS